MQTQPSPNPGQEKDSTSGQFLTFILDNEEYAIEILRVQGIQGWDRVTPIPNTPEFILGVINLRGSIVPILELRRRFELPSIDFGPTTVVIIVKILDNGNERTLGIVVDAVSEVYSLPLDEVRPPPEFSNDKNLEFVKGIATVDDKMLILLDVDSLLGDGSFRQLNTPIEEVA